MAKIVVDVMLKPEILDPQGNAVASALPRLGFSFAKSVRQGKRFEIEVEGEPTAAQLAEVEKAAEVLLSNPVIENHYGFQERAFLFLQLQLLTALLVQNEK